MLHRIVPRCLTHWKPLCRIQIPQGLPRGPLHKAALERRFVARVIIQRRPFASVNMPSKPKALLLGPIDHAKDTWKALSSIADLIEPEATDREAFLSECRSGRLDGVVAAYRTFTSSSVTGPFDSELIEALPASLEFVAHNGAGYDQIDVAACSARQPKPLRVSNVPTAPDDATADTALFLLLGALRRFNPGLQALRRGEWKGDPAPPLGHDPRGKVLAILGMGGIGRNLKRKTDALGMTAIYHNRNRLSDEAADGAEYVSFDELLARADVLSLNLPLNKHTRHIISDAEFGKLKRGAVVVNTARGAVMDEAALVRALDAGIVASAGLDVFEEEPEIHPGLVANPHVLLLPHMGTWCVETQTAMERWTIDNVRLALEEGRLKSPVPEQKDL